VPEAPDLEVVKEFLLREVAGRRIETVTATRPTVLRSLSGDFASDAAGRTIEEVRRRGKFLLIGLSGERWVAVNPMLTGVLQYGKSGDRRLKKTCITLTLDQGRELRYLDEKQMGKVYYLGDDQWDQVPALEEQGPDVLDAVPFEEFRLGLKRFRGEIKGVLTRGGFISGIGNAYADEVLFAAGISPFRKCGALTEEELRRLHAAGPRVVEDAIEVLRERVGDRIHQKIRDFLKVHNKGGEACPGCGGHISQLTANQRITSYCRRCQPGMLLRN
jgi:formamidopyrimidine-DNA glycosylase